MQVWLNDHQRAVKCYGLDPKELDALPAFKSKPKTSQRFYRSTWMSLVQKYNVCINKPPTEQNIREFLKSRMNGGMKNSTLRSNYSHLSLICQGLYKVKLSEMFCLADLTDSGNSTITSPSNASTVATSDSKFKYYSDSSE